MLKLVKGRFCQIMDLLISDVLLSRFQRYSGAKYFLACHVFAITCDKIIGPG